MQLSEEARVAKREYNRQYRERNAEKINAAARKWRADNPEKCAAITARYWQKKAEQFEEETGDGRVNQ